MLQKILSKIEPHLPSQYKEIAEHFSYVFALRVAQQLISFVSFFFIVKYVPQEIIGQYHFVLSIIGLVSITSMPGMRTALTQAIARGQGGFFKTASRYCIGASLLGSLVLFLIAGYYYFWQQDIVLSIAFIISAALYPATKGLLLWKSSFLGAERFKMLSVFDVSGILVTSVFLMLSALYYTETPVALLAITLVVPALQNLWLHSTEYHRYQNASNDTGDLYKYGLKSTGYHILPIIAQEIDKLSIYSFMTAKELALYNVANKIPVAVKTIIKDLGSVIMPKFARMPHYSKNLNIYLWAFSGVLFIGVVFFTLFIFPSLFKWLVPQEYEGGVIYGQILLGTIAINIHSLLKVSYIMSQNNIKSFQAVTMLSTIVKVVTAPVLIFFFHLWGAILAIALQRVVSLIGVEIIIHKFHKEKQ